MTKALKTSDVARILGCSLSHAVKLMDSGDIKAWKVPMSTHRRTSLEAVRAYVKRRGIKPSE